MHGFGVSAVNAGEVFEECTPLAGKTIRIGEKLLIQIFEVSGVMTRKLRVGPEFVQAFQFENIVHPYSLFDNPIQRQPVPPNIRNCYANSYS